MSFSTISASRDSSVADALAWREAQGRVLEREAWGLFGVNAARDVRCSPSRSGRPTDKVMNMIGTGSLNVCGRRRFLRVAGALAEFAADADTRPVLDRSVRLAESEALGSLPHLKQVTLSELAIDAEVDPHLVDGEYCLSARFDISLPGLDRSIVPTPINEAEQLCPYSKATKGNVDVSFNLL